MCRILLNLQMGCFCENVDAISWHLLCTAAQFTNLKGITQNYLGTHAYRNRWKRVFCYALFSTSFDWLIHSPGSAFSYYSSFICEKKGRRFSEVWFLCYILLPLSFKRSSHAGRWAVFKAHTPEPIQKCLLLFQTKGHHQNPCTQFCINIRSINELSFFGGWDLIFVVRTCSQIPNFHAPDSYSSWWILGSN